MTDQKYQIAVIGGGPGGLSAAAHAAKLGCSHVLLEKSSAIADTIQKYQKGKHVMAEPGILPLRSDLEFGQGPRETVLDLWAEGIADNEVNVRFKSEVVGIKGGRGDFSIELSDGVKIEAEIVILAIGLQGNLRKLGIAGDDAEFVSYQLDDPALIDGERILVVGAGDAAIENAIALADRNEVTIVNRRDEFSRAKDGNVALITDAIDSGQLQCLYNSAPVSLQAGTGEALNEVTLSCAEGDLTLKLHRVIARLGATPPRALVESFGVQFPSTDPASLPKLSAQYESSVSGLYIIGALAGYPLIKQAMNQGLEVVEYALGREIMPADHGLLEEKFALISRGATVDELLSNMQARIPLFEPINQLMFRELLLDSTIHTPQEGQVIFAKDDYTNSFFTIYEGEVSIQISEQTSVTSSQGNFFGELSLLSGRRRSATVIAGASCILIETPRKTINKLLNSVESAKRVLDETFILRAVQARFAPNAALTELSSIASKAVINDFRPGEAIFLEGEEADSLHLIRSGSVSVMKSFDGREIPMAYVSAGKYVGEMGLLGGHRRTATVRATVKTQTISLDSKTFEELLDLNPELRKSISDEISGRLRQNAESIADEEAGSVLDFLLKQGLGEATDVLLIDKSLCVNCDNCETACAESHDGTSRLNRQGGTIFAEVHVPTSCRHCEDPHCMKDCPPDAIQRAPGGEVYIGANCIGCGNCERNCPYDVIQMAYPNQAKKNFWSWLLFGFEGSTPSAGKNTETVGQSKDPIKQAVKCDMCKDLSGGPACVRACPTGAANRINPEQFIEIVSERAK